MASVLLLFHDGAHAQYSNLNFSGAAGWNTTSTVPEAPTPYLFPDGVTRTPADFVFQAGTSSVWNLNNGSRVICTESRANPYNRFFIGCNDGTSATLKFTTSTPLCPGLLCARLSNVAAMRIGEAATGSSGTLIIDGGVRIQAGYIYGEGPTPSIQIPNGRLDVLSGNSLRRLMGIAVTLGPRGALWILDPTASVTNQATFTSFTTGASVAPAQGNLIFQNNVGVTSALGDSSFGTLITVDPSPDSDGDGLPDAWEIARRLDPYDNGSTNSANGADGDPDHDGLTNAEEYFLGSDPQTNQFGYAWNPQPRKAGLLVVAAHPDDEGIFFGGTLPYYSQVAQIPVAFVSMTSGDYGIAPSIRENQLRQAAWAYGLRNQPLLPRFRNEASATVDDVWDWWANAALDGNDSAAGRLRASYYVAGVIRRYRPEVIVTHGANGEYGHHDHIATSQAVANAWSIAADPAVEIDGLPPWQAKKLYLHEWGTNRLFHDYWETPYDALGGLTPRKVAHNGLQYHFNLSTVSTVYLTGEVAPDWDAHPSELWGLYATTVGKDTVAPNFTVAGVQYNGWAKGDFLEHVDSPASAAPLIVFPGSIDVAYGVPFQLKPKVTNDSPLTAQTFAWTTSSGPGTVSFFPSSSVRCPSVSFSSSGQYVLRLTASDGRSSSYKEVKVNVLETPASVVCAINCGGPAYNGADGTAWQADNYYVGGTVSSAGVMQIASTRDETLYQSQRVGPCSYAIPVPNGRYLVTLRFAETVKNHDFLRRFHVNIEGVRVATSIDPFAVAGYARAYDRTFATTVSDGLLGVQFLEEIDKPSVAAILVRSVAPDQQQGGQATTWLQTTPLADSDGDGVSDQDEFVFGTSSAASEGSQLTLVPETHSLRFLTRVATGAGYEGLTRWYRVEASSTMQAGSWVPIWEGVADGGWKDVPFDVDAPRKFFRLVAMLK